MDIRTALTPYTLIRRSIGDGAELYQMETLIIPITSANTGIGWETAKALLQSTMSYHILLGSQSIIDVLINNAGVTFDILIGTDATNARLVFDDTYNINVSGTNMMTFVSASLLLRSPSPRLLFLTSGLTTMGKFTQSHIPVQDVELGWPKKDCAAAQAYRRSKAAINVLMLIWNFTLKQYGVKTRTIAPGLLATSMVGDAGDLKQRGAQPPSLRGQFIMSVIEGERDVDVGKVIA
ncbi:hypothetical protein GGI35DRAFT_470187 [Trichoderma velutinum]